MQVMSIVQHILETALEVEDLERSETFYRQLFGFPTILASDRLHVLSIHDRQVLLLFHRGGSTHGENTPGGYIPGHDAGGTMHVAFAISPEDVEPWRAKLAKLKIPIESEINPPKGGHSIYFRDPDNHLIELATPVIWGFILQCFGRSDSHVATSTNLQNRPCRPRYHRRSCHVADRSSDRDDRGKAL